MHLRDFLCWREYLSTENCDACGFSGAPGEGRDVQCSVAVASGTRGCGRRHQEREEVLRPRGQQSSVATIHLQSIPTKSHLQDKTFDINYNQLATTKGYIV